jgi:hypothetical protein
LGGYAFAAILSQCQCETGSLATALVVVPQMLAADITRLGNVSSTLSVMAVNNWTSSLIDRNPDRRLNIHVCNG